MMYKVVSNVPYANQESEEPNTAPATWNCHVRPPSADRRWWDWQVGDEAECPLPAWLKIVRVGDECLAMSLSRARLEDDTIACNLRSERAFAAEASSYQQIYRVWLTDMTIAWINEEVTITRREDGSYSVHGECIDVSNRFRQTAVGLGSAEQPHNHGFEVKASEDDDLQRRLRRTRETLDLVVSGGRWVAWSCDVKGPTEAEPWWDWLFRDDFDQTIPVWFDFDRRGDENLAWTLGRARLDEDRILCDVRAQEALSNGLPGYAQTFRVYLRDGRIGWIDESVVIRKVTESSWHLVGICVDATKRNSDEQQLTELRNYLVEQNKALEAQKAALAEANVLLEGLATIDGLTGIKNHRAFQEQLEKAWHAAVRHGRPLSLMMVDIDYFKKYNDAFGHPAGDEILKRVARLLQETARDCDFIARYGGEEFAIILPCTDRTGALALADRIRATIINAVWERRQITASFGVATTQPAMENAQALLMEADRALYCAKHAGRNCVRSLPVDFPQLEAAPQANPVEIQ